MSRIYLARTADGGIEIGKGKPATVLQTKKEDGISRERLLDFITYLKEKESISIESRYVVTRTIFNVCPHSVGILTKKELKMIKGAPSAQYVYEKLAAELAKKNPNWKYIPAFGYIFEEDLIEYLISVGFSDTEAEELTRIYEGRCFKRSKWEKDERLSTDFKVWASASGGFLQTRSYIPNLFRLEYLEFCHKNSVTDETTFTVTEASTRGAYNGYSYLTSRLMGDTGDGVILGYRDNYHKFDKEKLITLSELILKETGLPELWIRNINEDKVTVVKQTQEKENVLLFKDPLEGLEVIGKLGNCRIGIYAKDSGMPHFHIVEIKNGRRLAVNLKEPDYYRHNATETDFLTSEEVLALAAWMEEPFPEYETLGCRITNYQQLCVVWNIHNPQTAFRIKMPHDCPDYSALGVPAN